MDYIICGKHSVISAYKNKRAKKIYIDNQKKVEEFSNITIEIKNKNFFNKLTVDSSINHQGYAATVRPIKTFGIKDFENKNKVNLVALQGIEDQGNIGSIIRACAAFNIDALLIEKKNFKESSIQMNKAHVGNIENLKIVLTSNITNPIKQLKKNNFTIYCLDNNSEQDLKNYKFHKKSLLIFGSEGKGIKNYIKEQCDIALKIKINPNVESLNLSNAVAITLSNL